MVTYDSLTAEQKSILSAWESNTRAWFNGDAKLLHQAISLQSALNASNGPRDIITSLDAAEEVPNSSGLAGAHDLTKQEWSDLVDVLDAFILATNTTAIKELMAKAAGPTAGL